MNTGDWLDVAIISMVVSYAAWVSMSAIVNRNVPAPRFVIKRAEHFYWVYQCSRAIKKHRESKYEK